MADEDRLDQLFRDALDGERARVKLPPDLWQRVRQAGVQPGPMLDLDRCIPTEGSG